MLKNIKNNIIFLNYLHKSAPSYMYVSTITNILTKLTPFISLSCIRLILDNLASEGKNFDYVSALMAGSIGYSLFANLVSRWVGNIYETHVDTKIRNYMQCVLFDKIKTIDLQNYENNQYFDKYVKATSDAENRIKQVAITFSNYISSLLALTASIFIISTLNILMVVLSILIVIINTYMTSRNQKNLYKRQMDNIPNQRKSQYFKNLHYNPQYAKEMRLYSLWNFCKNKYIESMSEIKRILLKYSKKIFIIDSSSFTLTTMMQFLISLYILKNIYDDNLSVGSYMLISGAMTQVTVQLSTIVSIIPQIQQHSLFIDNFNEFMNYQPIIKTNENGVNLEYGSIENITLENINFSYPNRPDINVLKNINIKINKGCKIAIVGHNGAGKSTLVKLILHLYKPDSGKLYINEQIYDNYNLNSLQEKFGIMFQDYQIYSFTVAENIIFKVLKSENEINYINDALEFAGISDLINDLPFKIETTITKEFDENGIYLSQGEQQKIAIARVYYGNKDVLIFDEPSSSLDPIAEYNLYEKMMQLSNNKIVIFISHRLSTVVNADCIYYMESGEIVEQGTHDELMQYNGKYAYMFNIQAKNYLKEKHDNL